MSNSEQPPGESDLELLAQWRGGSGRAGSALVKRHFAALHRFFANKAAAHAEDLVQQTFMACVESRDAFRGDASFRAYLFGLARLQLYTHYRARARTRSLDFTTTSVRDLGASPTAACAQREEAQLLGHALQSIPLEQQITLELIFWEGLTAPEIARALGIPEATVYSRLRRAKGHLRRALSTLASERATSMRAYALLTEARPRGPYDP